MKQFFFLFLTIMVFTGSGCSNQKLVSANDQIQKLNNQILILNGRSTDLNAKLSDSDKEIAGLKNEIAMADKKTGDCSRERKAIAARLDELSRILQEQGDTLQEIRRKASDALNAFGNRNVEVKYRNGMVYISMLDQFLFESGSTKINSGSRPALTVIADILTKYPNVSAIVVGNTDTLKVMKGYRDNWSLSTERANTVVRILYREYGSDPTRLTAAGKSKYHPVASNATEEGRAKNRRTDIIINPDLSSLWLLSQKYP
jgi:chemotaxis protein MotB